MCIILCIVNVHIGFVLSRMRSNENIVWLSSDSDN